MDKCPTKKSFAVAETEAWSVGKRPEGALATVIRTRASMQPQQDDRDVVRLSNFGVRSTVRTQLQLGAVACRRSRGSEVLMRSHRGFSGPPHTLCRASAIDGPMRLRVGSFSQLTWARTTEMRMELVDFLRRRPILDVFAQP